MSIGRMSVQPSDCRAQDAIWLQRPALVNSFNMSRMLVTREDLQTVLVNTMSLEDLLKGAPYHAEMSIFHRAFIWVGPSLYQVDGTLISNGIRKIKLMTGASGLQNSNKLVTVQELLDESTNRGNESISNRLLDRITDWASCGKLPPFTVHQAASVAFRLQKARHCFAAALDASMLPAGPEQIAKTATYKQCINDILNSMQGTLPAGTMMQYSSNVETPLSPPVSMPAVEPRPMQLQHGFLAHGWGEHVKEWGCVQVSHLHSPSMTQGGSSRARSHAAQACEHTASSTVFSQLSTVSSMSAKSGSSSSCQPERPQHPDAATATATCLGREHGQGTAQMSGLHQPKLDLPTWSAVPMPTLPYPLLSRARSKTALPPPSTLGSPLSELQSRASLPSAPSQQSLAPVPQPSSLRPASPVNCPAAVLSILQQLPQRLAFASADAPLESKQVPMPHPLLRPEDSAHSAPCSKTAPAYLPRLQSISSSCGSQVHCAPASASQAGCVASQATSVILHWRLGQHSHVHGNCAMIALQLSAEDWPGLATGLLLGACHLVDLRDWQSCRPPVMRLHAAEAISEPSRTAEFVRLHTLLSCTQQGLLAFDSGQPSGQAHKHTPLLIFPHNEGDVASNWTKKETDSELCMYAAAYPGTHVQV